jgi:hypothetical protein
MQRVLQTLATPSLLRETQILQKGGGQERTVQFWLKVRKPNGTIEQEEKK